MADKYSGTSLTDDENMNKAALDLLKKVNEVSGDAQGGIDTLTSGLATTNKNLGAIKDYVVEIGGTALSSGYWRKWNSGWMDMWGSQVNSTAMTSATPDPGYFIPTIAIALPASFISTGYMGWGCTTGNGITDAFGITPNTVSSANGYIWCAHAYGSRTMYWNVRGKWK